MPSIPIPAPFEAYKGDAPYAFVSYAHADAHLVLPDIASLRSMGVNIWYDEGIDPGNEWPEEIAVALDRSSLFICYVTPRSVDSRNCRNEIHFALDTNKAFVAIHLEETELPKGLALRMGDLQAIMKYRIDPQTYERKIRKVIELLHRETKASHLPAILSPPGVRPQVILEFTSGQLQGQKRSFMEPATLLFGRDKGCDPRFPGREHPRISHHHALVEINPPHACVRDLGSRNGTFVNGELVGKRPPGTGPGKQHASAERDLVDGAVVFLARERDVAFRVHVVVPARCTGCGAGIADERKPACAQPTGGYLCQSCRHRAEAEAVVKPCAWCQREVRTERGANRPGLFICADCRNNLKDMMGELLGQAQAGNSDLRVLRGYDILEELAAGGMGAVYLARHQRTGEAAAIKLLLPKVAADEEAVALFQREIRNTMTLNHRHVVRLLDHGFARGAFFMVLEYCDGGTVEDLRVQRGGVLPVDEAVEIALQALEGLEYCHTADIPFVRQKGGGYGPGRGVVHRDVKPANLFLTGWGSGRVVRVGDFGLAKAFAESGLSGGTRTGDVGGTYEFMCRQQVAAYRDAGPEVDVWSLAATLYYLLTGCTPRDFGDGDRCLAVLEVDPTPIRKRRSDLPSRLAEVIDAALKEEPAMTFKTAGAFKRALEDAV
jgi:serine/threonine-protein kinase